MADDLALMIAERKAALDALRPLSAGALAALQDYYDVELTYSSNAIEGNTLTHRETAEVIAHGITVGGKPLRDHLEAQDHYAAVRWVRDLARAETPVEEAVVTELHRRIVLRSNPDIAGSYSAFPRRVAGSAVIFPNPAKLPALMADFGAWLAAQPPGYGAAFDAHYRLVSIHPFSDVNGRTARLLMNLLLLRSGYPPVAIGPDDRAAYLDSLERGQLADDPAGFMRFLQRRLLATLDGYLAALQPE